MNIKRTLFSMALLLAVSAMQAIPAKREAVRVQQPDGSFVTIMLHGDEWMHFTTTDDGYTVEKNEQGYYVYAEKRDGLLRATTIVAHDAAQRTAEEHALLVRTAKYLQPRLSEHKAALKRTVEQREQQKRAARRASQYDYNNFRGLIILVQWNDKQFSRTDYTDIITDMVNKEDYTGYGNQHYTGSVRDYFSDNSNGLFKPQFDIAGPYTVDYSQYDPKGGYQYGDSQYDPTAYARITKDVLDAADADIDFSQYDGDGDGFVDLIYFIVAGNGSNYGGSNKGLWWPHRSVVYDPTNYSYIVKDGVTLYDYASSTELMGYASQPSSVKIDGIGTICHEFSHVLGLPDFYDTNYEEDGQSNHPDLWSVMAGGSYENDGRTPVGYSLYERYAVGFTDEPQVIDATGDYTLEPLPTSLTGYRINTPVADEFFLLENRQKDNFKWDAYLPGHGMLVHRVDFTNKAVWGMGDDAGNDVNANASHNYYELLRAGGAKKRYGEYYASPTDPFPGTSQKHALSNVSTPAHLKTWAGKENKYALSNIQESNGTITFTVTEYALEALSLPQTLTVGTFLSAQLAAEATPSYATYTLTWASSDEEVATVDQEGVVTGIAAGTCTITATADNGMTASCNVTVEEMEVNSVAEFKEKDDGTEHLLQFSNAAVLHVDQNAAYVRDDTGTLMLQDTGMTLKQNDVLNGIIFLQKDADNEVPKAIGTSQTNLLQMDIQPGSEVQPLEVTLDELTSVDYSDYVLVKAARLTKESNGVWAVSDNNKVRLRNPATVKPRLRNYEGKYYDILAIYCTGLADGEIIPELLMTVGPTEVDAPTPSTAIREVSTHTSNAGATYNMSGQRVSDSYKGLTIRNGKKHLIK